MTQEYIDSYIFRELNSTELESFVNRLKSDSHFQAIVEDRELELIEKFLNGNLKSNLRKKIENRIKSDKNFEGKVLFEKSLLTAAKILKERNELGRQLEEIKQKVNREKIDGTYKPISNEEHLPFKDEDFKSTRHSKIYPGDKSKMAASPISVDTGKAFRKEYTLPNKKYSLKPWIYLMTIAASIALFILFVPPFLERQKIEKYLAYSGPAKKIDIDIWQINAAGDRSSDSSNVFNFGGIQAISIIDNEKFKNRYFIKDKILYVYHYDTSYYSKPYQDTEKKIRVITRINTEGQAQYYLCLGERLFMYSINKENNIQRLESVADTTLLKFCN